MDPYRSPQVPPGGREPSSWRDWARAPARLAAVALPVAVACLIGMEMRARLVYCNASVNDLWGAPAFALACSIGVSALLLLGARFSPRG